MNNDVNSNQNKQPETLVNDTEVNAVPTNNVSDKQHTEVLDPVVETTQRVNLVQDKPNIQAVLPNNNVNGNQVSNPVENSGVPQDGYITNVPMKEVNIEPGKSSGGVFQTIMLLLLFVGLLLVVIYLPDISEYIEFMLDDMKKEADDLRVDLNKMEAQVEELGAEISQKTAELSQKDAELSQKDAEIARLKALLEQR